MYQRLAHLALVEFSDIIVGYEMIGRRTSAPLKLRLHVRDATFIDVWLSPDRRRYAYHWEQRAVRGRIYRHDNAPDHPEIATFPKHVHNGKEDIVDESRISSDPFVAIQEFLQFVREYLSTNEA
jgi:hypothetical protein